MSQVAPVKLRRIRGVFGGSRADPVLPRHLFSLALALIAALLVVLVPKSEGTT